MPTHPPNIVLVIADQLAPQSLPVYGHPLVRAPHIAALAASGVVFDNAYCNAPLCAPSRFSFLSGRHCSRIGAYDNAAEFPSAVPTLAHYLRRLGYLTLLCGKMHLVGADQLHGFEERLTTDVYPADFGWFVDWENPRTRPFWYHNMLSVVEAGRYERTLQLDFDEEVAHQARRRLYELGRRRDRQPFFLTVSFTQPHDPYMAPGEWWDRYDHAAIDPPRVGPFPADRTDPHSRRLQAVYATDEYEVGDDQVRNARHAYYAMISWVDDQIGELRKALETTGLDRDTMVVIAADHGDMLGERGLWYKMCFYERALRVPLIFSGAGIERAGRRAENVTLLDLLPTVVDFGGGATALGELETHDGASLRPLIEGRPTTDFEQRTVAAEYLAEGAVAPMLMLKHGPWKQISCPADPAQLFNLDADPLELDNLAGRPEVTALESKLDALAAAHWDPASMRERVIASQRDRRIVHAALMRGKVTPWDFQPRRDAATEYNRNHGNELYDTDRRARIPYREAPPPKTR